MTRLLFLFSSLAILAGCSNAARIRAQEREKLSLNSGLYCDFINGDEYADVEVQLNLEIARRCDANRNISLTSYKNSSEIHGIVYCCALVKKGGHELRTEARNELRTEAPKAAPKPAAKTVAPAASSSETAVAAPTAAKSSAETKGASEAKPTQAPEAKPTQVPESKPTPAPAAKSAAPAAKPAATQTPADSGDDILE